MNSYANDFTQTVQTYYKDLKKYNPIPKEKELDLIKQAKKNNLLAKNTILSSNLKFVFDIAKKYKGKGVAMEDLIAEGNMGLVKALDKFDTSKDVKFISYAVWWVRQSMQEVIKKRQQQISIEINDEETTPSIKKCHLHDSEDELILPNENMLSNEDDANSLELNNAQSKILNKLLNKLNPRARYIIKSYYGFDKDEMTLEEIGNELNLSRERVRQIKEKNLRILRSEILLLDNFDDLFLK